MIPFPEVAIRLLVATLLIAIVGMERERLDRAAGHRSHASATVVFASRSARENRRRCVPQDRPALAPASGRKCESAREFWALPLCVVRLRLILLMCRLEDRRDFHVLSQIGRRQFHLEVYRVPPTQAGRAVTERLQPERLLS